MEARWMDEEQRRREAGGRPGGRRGRTGEAEACMISLLILMNT